MLRNLKKGEFKKYSTFNLIRIKYEYLRVDR